MKYFYIALFSFMNIINLGRAQGQNVSCYCQVNSNEIAPVIPCLTNTNAPATDLTISGCVEDPSILMGMNNKTCLALQPYSAIQQFLRTCTEISSEQEYSQWVVASLCPDLDEDDADVASAIASKCVNFDDTQCLCEQQLYAHEPLFRCFRRTPETQPQSEGMANNEANVPSTPTSNDDNTTTKAKIVQAAPTSANNATAISELEVPDYNTCKSHGWIIDSSAININNKFLPIGILALFATLFF